MGRWARVGAGPRMWALYRPGRPPAAWPTSATLSTPRAKRSSARGRPHDAIPTLTPLLRRAPRPLQPRTLHAPAAAVGGRAANTRGTAKATPPRKPPLGKPPTAKAPAPTDPRSRDTPKHPTRARSPTQKRARTRHNVRATSSRPGWRGPIAPPNCESHPAPKPRFESHPPLKPHLRPTPPAPDTCARRRTEARAKGSEKISAPSVSTHGRGSDRTQALRKPPKPLPPPP